MIKINDLRQGNLVRNYKGEILVWDWPLLTEGNNVWLKAGGSELWIVPMPLSQEWIRNLGYYTKVTNKGTDVESIPFYDNGSRLVLDWDNLSPTWQGEELELPYKLEYVHQLQNLYYSLTGEELSINL